MPKSAAATFDDDFGAFETRRRSAPRKPQPATSRGQTSRGQTSRGRKGGKNGRFRLDMAKVARVAAIGMGATLALGIMVNALMMQKSRHPAPLFGQTIALPKQAASKEAVAQVVAPVKPAPPAPPPVIQPMSQPVAQPSAAKSHRAAAAPDKPADDDAIARLLNGGGEKKAAKGEANADTRGDVMPEGKTVLGVQRALAKLGFTIKPSGTFGPQTRKAIEAFEKDRHLPVKGEVSPRLVKVLSAESGVKLN